MADQGASSGLCPANIINTRERDGTEEIDIIGTLEELKAKSKGQNYANIVERCQTEHGWFESKTASVIELAIQNEAIYETMYRGKKTFRINDPNKVIIRDVCENDSTPKQKLDVSCQNDYHESNQLALASITDLISIVNNLSHDLNKTTLNQHQGMGNGSNSRSIITILEARICSLERQLDEKQTIIELLIGSNLGQRQQPFLEESPNNSNNNVDNSNNNKSSTAKKQDKKHFSNTTASYQLGIDNTPGKKAKSKKAEKPQNNDANDVQYTQGRNTAIEQSQVSTKGLPSSNTENTSEREKKKITIIGDSMLNGINDRGLNNKKRKVCVKNHPGANTEDILDHLKPALRRNPDLIIIHSGTNDIMDDNDTIKFLDKAVELSRKECPKTKVAISLPIMRKDKDGKYTRKVRDLKRKIQKHCMDENIPFIDNDNISQDGLGMKGLHLNRKGNSQLARNFIDFINSFNSY